MAYLCLINRFTVQGQNGYPFSYNPCISFIKGPAGNSYCYSDVAVSNESSSRNLKKHKYPTFTQEQQMKSGKPIRTIAHHVAFSFHITFAQLNLPPSSIDTPPGMGC